MIAFWDASIGSLINIPPEDVTLPDIRILPVNWCVSVRVSPNLVEPAEKLVVT